MANNVAVRRIDGENKPIETLTDIMQIFFNPIKIDCVRMKTKTRQHIQAHISTYVNLFYYEEIVYFTKNRK